MIIVMYLQGCQREMLKRHSVGSHCLNDTQIWQEHFEMPLPDNFLSIATMMHLGKVLLVQMKRLSSINGAR